MSSAEPGHIATRDDIRAVFEAFRVELDDHNDRRERLIKQSRDITNLSKKVIFLLHRVLTDDLADKETDENGDKLEKSEKGDRARVLRAAARAREKLREIQLMFAAIRGELQGDRFWRYQRQVSPGLQEYIEALSFTHYLETGTLVSFEEVQKTLSDEHGVAHFPLPLEEYLLGLSDLTGELMRYAISSISQRGGRTKASEICVFVRSCRADFEAMTPHFRELRKKQAVTSQSLQKIEDAAYAIVVRSSEYELSPDMLDDIVERTVTTLSAEGGRGGGGRKRGRENDSDEDD